ncbi:SDR family oxidoreductase [Sphingobium sp.]|uniref:SDR family oxidoreductase n=1 Tax=Sphingobium sp. TaxID=1912891 RepID=UPI0028BE2260|nr:SDR family oxidoreductase [Sphingobium sp.]
MTDIAGKVALITGASSGIGEAAAIKLAAAGMKVGIAARRVGRLEALNARIAESGGEALVIEMDVADAASVNSGVAKLAEAYGAVDVLFNNAGVMPMSQIDELRIDDWNRTIDINFRGVLNATAAVLPHMIKQRSGHILNTSSIAGRRVNIAPGLTVYSATKFAVNAFTEGLRTEIGPKHNIRVTCIQPGLVATELGEKTGDPQQAEQVRAFSQMIKFLDGADIADAVLYAIQAPEHVNVSELLVVPVQQPV